jgi:hypothetical protein
MSGDCICITMFGIMIGMLTTGSILWSTGCEYTYDSKYCVNKWKKN